MLCYSRAVCVPVDVHSKQVRGGAVVLWVQGSLVVLTPKYVSFFERFFFSSFIRDVTLQPPYWLLHSILFSVEYCCLPYWTFLHYIVLTSFGRAVP